MNSKNDKKMATIYYHDIGDYLSREQKLKMVHDFRSIKSMEWTEIVPNEKGDWINQRDNSFDTLLPLFPLKKFGKGEKCFFMTYSLGIASSRDTWVWNFNRKSINHNMHKTIAYYKACFFLSLPRAKRHTYGKMFCI